MEIIVGKTLYETGEFSDYEDPTENEQKEDFEPFLSKMGSALEPLVIECDEKLNSSLRS